MSVSSFSSAAKPGVCLSTDRPDSPFDGQVIYETDTNRTLVYDNSAWVVIHDPTLMSYSGTGVTVTADAATVSGGLTVSGATALSTATLGGENVTPYTGRKNAILNGDMRIAQRYTSDTHGAGGGNVYWYCDRWNVHDFIWSAGSNVTISQSTDAPSGFQHSAKWANGATPLTFSSGGSQFMRQRVEGYNAAHLYDSTYVTVSFWVKSSTAGTYSFLMANGAFTRVIQKEYSISSANTWEYKSITIPMSTGTSSGVWDTTTGEGIGLYWYFGAASDRTGDDYLDSWGDRVNYHYLTTNSVNLATIANSSFYLTGVQLEVGDKATPFEHRSYGEELALCQRYYYKTKADDSFQPFGAGVCSTSTQLRAIVQFPIEMRTSPDSLETTGTGSDYYVLRGGPNGIACTSVSWSSTSKTTGVVLFNVASGLTSGDAAYGRSQATNAYLAWSAEL